MSDDLSPVFDGKDLKITHAIIGGHVFEMRGGRLIEPALTAEEWKRYLGEEAWDIPGRMEHAIHGTGNMHFVAALALYGQPFGFTDDDVCLLDLLVEGLPDAVARRVRSLADRIEALLPPEG